MEDKIITKEELERAREKRNNKPNSKKTKFSSENGYIAKTNEKSNELYRAFQFREKA